MQAGKPAVNTFIELDSPMQRESYPGVIFEILPAQNDHGRLVASPVSLPTKQKVDEAGKRVGNGLYCDNKIPRSFDINKKNWRYVVKIEITPEEIKEKYEMGYEIRHRTQETVDGVVGQAFLFDTDEEGSAGVIFQTDPMVQEVKETTDDFHNRVIEAAKERTRSVFKTLYNTQT